MGEKNLEATKSLYGKGFILRISALLFLLVLVVSGLVYDRVILHNINAKKIKDAYGLMVAADEDGHGITKETVRKTIGFEPESVTIEDGKYEVEKYTFPRALSFVNGEYLNVIYEDGTLIQMLQNQPYSADKVKIQMGVRSADKDKFTGMKVQLGGVPTSSIPKEAGGTKKEGSDGSEGANEKPAEKADAERTQGDS